MADCPHASVRRTGRRGAGSKHGRGRSAFPTDAYIEACKRARARTPRWRARCVSAQLHVV
eukprot:7254342-Lingulodinium_polyedra.AAC.1